MDEKGIRKFIKQQLVNGMEKLRYYTIEKISSDLTDIIDEKIHAAILADRKERELDVDKVFNELANKELLQYAVSGISKASANQLRFYAEVVCSAFNAPRRVSVEEIEKLLCSRCHFISECIEKNKKQIPCNDIAGKSAKAIHSLVYGDAEEKEEPKNCKVMCPHCEHEFVTSFNDLRSI